MVASTHLGRRSGFYKENDTSIVKQQRQKKPVAWELLKVPVCDKEIAELDWKQGWLKRSGNCTRGYQRYSY